MTDELKKSVLLAAQEAERMDLCKHKSGNFSARDPESGSVTITPSGVARSALQCDQLCTLDLDARVLEWDGVHKPSSEVLMHLEIYRRRPDVHAVAHTHSRFATAFAILNKTIPPILYECSFLGRSPSIRVAPYARPGTTELARAVSETLLDADCCLMQSHGAIAVGASMEEAFLRAQYMEEMAELYYLTLSVRPGQEPPVLDEGELRKWTYPQEILF